MTAREDFFAAPRLFTIDSGRPFLADLARGLVALSGGDAVALSGIDLYLPNRRAARALGEAFLSVGGGRATLLPRIRPLGEADEDAALMAPGGEEDAALTEAISPLERRLVLARFVAAARDRSFSGQESWTAALKGADALAGFLDSLYTEEADATRLESLAPEIFAAHWRRSLDFLKIVTEAWPRYLEGRGLDDPARRRARVIARQAERAAALPAQGPVVIAGTTGSMPAVRRLMKAVAETPQGIVVLPGLDRALAADRRAWAAVDDGHPQAGLKALLESLGIEPEAVRLWPGSDAASGPRARLLSVALRPADATGDWRARLLEATADDAQLQHATAGLSLVEAADEEDEAAAIAIAFRETLETERETALLVTPDRNLARRVAAKMRRWEVEVYDSGGTPLANTVCGTFLRLAADSFAAPDDAEAALALVRHPLATLGLDAAARRRAAAAFDRAMRGLQPHAATGGLIAKAGEGAAGVVASVIAPPEEFRSGAPLPLAALIAAHVEGAERIAATESETGAQRLWTGEDGAAAAALLGDLRDAADALGAAAPADYPALFADLIATAAARRRGGAHPRLEILGPLEARLQSADLVILGGLNEGVWPGDGGADPFLSRAMRQALGLPSPERAIGLSAHDFAQGAAAPRVLLTRARRRAGAPAKPSRWIVRLKNMLSEAGALSAVDVSARYAFCAEALDAAGPARPVSPPAPRPPLASRPRKLSVTQIETFLRDPYAIFARHILGLKALDPAAEPFGAKHLGTLLHAALERFVLDRLDPGGPGAIAALAALVDRLAPEHGLFGADRMFWAPTIENSLSLFLEGERTRRAAGAPALVEKTGEIALPLAGGPFTLTARADRIDLLNDARAFVIDYKSNPPSKKEMALFRVQLPLTALIVEQGGFADIGARKVAAFAYLRILTRKDEAEAEGAQDEEARTAIEAAANGVRAWLDAFDHADQPYLSQPRPQFVNDYGDYDLLARRREWNIGSEE